MQKGGSVAAKVHDDIWTHNSFSKEVQKTWGGFDPIPRKEIPEIKALPQKGCQRVRASAGGKAAILQCGKSQAFQTLFKIQKYL